MWHQTIIPAQAHANSTRILEIDAMPLGAATIARQAIVLGLPMISHAPHLASGFTKTSRSPAQIAALAFQKPVLKGIERGALLGRTISPLQQATLAFGLWIQSVAYYVSCVFVAGQRFVNSLQQI